MIQPGSATMPLGIDIFEVGQRRCFDPSSTRAAGVGQIDMASLALLGRGLGKRGKRGKGTGKECTVCGFRY